jgi:hypothetical protein
MSLLDADVIINKEMQTARFAIRSITGRISANKSRNLSNHACTLGLGFHVRPYCIASIVITLMEQRCTAAAIS